MRRAMLTLIVFATLSVWAGAQNTAPLTAEIQVKQFKANRDLIQNLVDHGINLSNADSPLTRAEACRLTSLTLVNSLERAAGAEDAERVAEFGNLFGEIVRDGLVPNLEAAKKHITDDRSPDAGRWRTVKDDARRDLEAVRKAIVNAGKVGDNDKVKTALQLINELSGKLNP
jgi:hypothetical protein